MVSFLDKVPSYEKIDGFSTNCSILQMAYLVSAFLKVLGLARIKCLTMCLTHHRRGWRVSPG